jgi:hypothetical protein
MFEENLFEWIYNRTDSRTEPTTQVFWHCSHQFEEKHKQNTARQRVCPSYQNVMKKAYKKRYKK